MMYTRCPVYPTVLCISTLFLSCAISKISLRFVAFMPLTFSSLLFKYKHSLCSIQMHPKTFCLLKPQTSIFIIFFLGVVGAVYILHFISSCKINIHKTLILILANLDLPLIVFYNGGSAICFLGHGSNWVVHRDIILVDNFMESCILHWVLNSKPL